MSDLPKPSQLFEKGTGSRNISNVKITVIMREKKEYFLAFALKDCNNTNFKKRAPLICDVLALKAYKPPPKSSALACLCMVPALTGVVQGTIGAATEKIAYSRKPSIKNTLKVGIKSDVIADSMQFIG